MVPFLLGVLVFLTVFQSSAAAQARTTGDTAPLPPSVFRPLPLPAANQYRAASGRPGRGDWQQRVSYRIAVTLDTARQRLQGRETIRYTNNSPDALPYLWLFIEQNICAPKGITEQLDQPPLVFLGSTFDFSCKGFAGGVTLGQVSVAGRKIRPVVYGTTMRLDLPRAL